MMLTKNYFLLLTLALNLLSSSAALAGPCGEGYEKLAREKNTDLVRALEQLNANPYRDQLFGFEAIEKFWKGNGQSMKGWHPQAGIEVTERDAQGNPIRGRLRVLTDNPGSRIQFTGDSTGWRAIDLQPDPNDRAYAVAEIPLTQGMEYRLMENGQQRIDPASVTYTSPELTQRLKGQGVFSHLNSIFWDYDHPGAYKMEAVNGVDLRGRIISIEENTLWNLAAQFPFQGRRGPASRAQLYRFVAESGIAKEIKKWANVVELMPPTTYVDGDVWAYAYLNYGPYGPDSRGGTPDEFNMAVDALQKEGVAVIVDLVPGHYPKSGNAPGRELEPVGPAQWRNHFGQSLYGDLLSPWGTYRPNLLNPYIRQYWKDAILNLFKHNGISGYRMDNVDGVRWMPGGNEFIRELNEEIRKYRPYAFLNGEGFSDHKPVITDLRRGGMGMDTTNNDSFWWKHFRDVVPKFKNELDMNSFRDAVREADWWHIVPRMYYPGNHDEYANEAGGMSGDYPATKLDGGGDFHTYGKLKVFHSWAQIFAFSMNMRQAQSGQRGSLRQNPELEWQELTGVRKQLADYFSALFQVKDSHTAFAIQNHHPEIENGYDNVHKVLSMLFIDWKTGKKVYAVFNFGDDTVDQYRFGVGANPGERYRVALDSDRSEYAGQNLLKNRLPGNELTVVNDGWEGKPHSIVLPVLAPYQVLILTQQ